LKDILGRAKGLRGLIVLRAAEPGHLTAAGFQHGVGYEAETSAAELRADLKAAQLVSANETSVPIPIRLTELGRKAADLAVQIDALSPDVIDLPRRALPALVALLDSEPEPMTPRTFREAVGYAINAGLDLRDDLARMGLIHVEDELVGRQRYVRIRLTDKGRAVADLARRIRKIVENAREGTRKGRA